MRVATVQSVYRYPVKSMRGELLGSAELTLQGIPGDRRYAFVQAQSRRDFPWLTGRQVAEMLRYQPRLDSATAAVAGVHVGTPDGQTLAVDSDELRAELEQRFGGPLFLMRDYRGNYDVAPISLISLGTTARIATESGTAHEPGRFRANLYLDIPEGDGYEEETWVGRVVRVGETARVAITEADERCAMITLDPTTAQATSAVLAAVARLHANRAGVYGVVLTPGRVRAGDPVFIEG
jgi:MOSC domain-containing protein